ncbi:hypothetical protein LVD17_27665 [Fulvivirga ulvae]|uniref:HepT-like ribonuclease domain-containing protein n=1 Tax=Fulvivirga ulvae TaxID=2904245 RepID=UPI001F1B140D|nr:HepT-like ribonuclease domain-containing protein [Fulvivirga ulvae]UII32065.1 hypothetical protein LVD17_27665 [Fulvivirga ulvae]
MTKEEQQLHLNNIIKGIEEIQEETRGLNYRQFTEEEQVKESVYMNFQMIGQAAHELESGSDDVPGLNFKSDILSGFRNARYNGEAELDHQMIWNVIENDLEIIRDEIMETSAEMDRPSENELKEADIENTDRRD